MKHIKSHRNNLRTQSLNKISNKQLSTSPSKLSSIKYKSNTINTTKTVRGTVYVKISLYVVFLIMWIGLILSIILCIENKFEIKRTNKNIQNMMMEITAIKNNLKKIEENTEIIQLKEVLIMHLNNLNNLNNNPPANTLSSYINWIFICIFGFVIFGFIIYIYKYHIRSGTAPRPLAPPTNPDATETMSDQSYSVSPFHLPLGPLAPTI